MGQVIGIFPGLKISNKVKETPKRKRTASVDEDLSETSEDEGYSYGLGPERKRLRTTSEYIFNTLFLNGENSDIEISALGTSWKLHKVYLCQSGFFRGMLKGQWRESGQPLINIEISDETVDKKALDIAFGSMYSDEVDIIVLRDHVIPALAAARLLDLGGLLRMCEDVMTETLSAATVCSYYDAASRYGLMKVESKCFQWLERNLLLCRTPIVAKQIRQELLEQVLSSREFVVMQVEVDVYNFLKIWVYLQLHPDCDLPLKVIVQETQKYFIDRFSEENTVIPFLATEEGLRFAMIFKCLKLCRLLEDAKAIQMITRDAIIPKEWLLPKYEEQWNRMLSVFSGSDLGPSEVTDDEFEKNSCRCGRILEKNTRYCWRWTGFSCGVDLIVTYDNRTRSLAVKRNTYSQPCNSAICMQSQRAVALRFRLFTLGPTGSEILNKDTGLLRVMLKTDEEAPLLQLEDHWTFPVFVSARIMIASD